MATRVSARIPGKALHPPEPKRLLAGRPVADRRGSAGRWLVFRAAAVPTITAPTRVRRRASRRIRRSTGVCRPAIAPARLVAATRRTICRGGSSLPPAPCVRRSGASPELRPRGGALPCQVKRHVHGPQVSTFIDRLIRSARPTLRGDVAANRPHGIASRSKEPVKCGRYFGDAGSA